MYRSITTQILSLPDNCLIYPAHDYAGRTSSSVGEERAHNPRIGGQADERDFVGFMENLNLPHPKQMDIAVPANMRSGRPETGSVPRPADWGPVRQGYSGFWESMRCGYPSTWMMCTFLMSGTTRNCMKPWGAYQMHNGYRCIS